MHNLHYEFAHDIYLIHWTEIQFTEIINRTETVVDSTIYIYMSVCLSVCLWLHSPLLDLGSSSVS
jgi:hypothetical protein